MKRKNPPLSPSQPDLNTKEKAATISAVVSALLSCLLLCTVAADCEKYKEADSVSAAITFTSPKKEKPLGFWDIFSEAVTDLFNDI
ncbi:MAG: hypothetical protein IJF69_04875 [Clostridia bacterium]|nr:hypothetical protein [Clostridia bacterium]